LALGHPSLILALGHVVLPLDSRAVRVPEGPIDFVASFALGPGKGLSVAWPGASSPAAHTGPLSHDFLRGFLIGIAIVLEIVGVGIAASAARVTRKS